MKKRNIFILLFSILFFSISIPLSLNAFSLPFFTQQKNTPSKILDKKIELQSIIEVPKIVVNKKTIQDFSKIDWERKINNSTLNSDETLETLNIPQNIKTIVKLYRNEKDSINKNFLLLPKTRGERIRTLKEGLQFSILRKMIENGELPSNYLELSTEKQNDSLDNVFDAKNSQIVDYKKIIEVKETSSRIIKVEEVILKPKNKLTSFIQDLLKKVITKLKPDSVFADIATVSSSGLSYLINTQNPDGSWGNDVSTKFITTSAVVDALQTQNVVGSTTDKGVEWLSYYFADNNDFLAQKTKILIRAGEATSTFETLLRGFDEESGGFIFDNSYAPDPLTSARALQALFVAGYKDFGDNNTLTEAKVINYLIDSKRFDNGWSAFIGGISSIQATTEVIQALLPDKNFSIGGVPLTNTIDPVVSTLISTQMPNGTWRNDLLDTALAYYAIKASGEFPTYQLNTVNYFTEKQSGNGSFNNDAYVTAKILKALSLGTDSGKLIVNDISAGTVLQTGLSPAEITLSMSNPGSSIINKGKLHFLADNYHIKSFDFQTNGISINPGSTLNITIQIGNTRNYIGDVNFKVFVEGTSGIIHPDSLYSKTLNFLPDPANRPGLPMYFVTYKSTSSTNGTPAITWKWPIKFDPNLKNIVLLFRKIGTTTWSQASVTATTTTSGATVSGLVSDQEYEATLGTSSQSGNIYLYSSPVSVKLNSSNSIYTNGSVSGTVKSLSGTLKNIDVSGVTSQTLGTSNEEGFFIQRNIPWGTGFAKVSDFRYEPFIIKYTNSDDALVDMDVFTNLKVDTQIPNVSNVSIVGEGDKIIENKKNQLIQYTVNDDIGDGTIGIVQSVTLHYFDPRSNSWKLIGNESGFISGTRTFEWYVPKNLLGNGYKIKVTARDFAGKDSIPTEWGGIFEIIESNLPPTFSFLSPVLGGISNTDVSYLIKWTDKDEDDNADIIISYDIDNNPNNGNHVQILAIKEDDPLNEYFWNIGQNVPNLVYIRSDITDNHNPTRTLYSSIPINISHIDKVSPTGSIIINNGETETSSNALNLTLNANDIGSGMGIGAQMQFAGHNGNSSAYFTPFEPYKTTKVLNLSTSYSKEDIRTIIVKFKDVAGNISIPYSASIKKIQPVETVPPTGYFWKTPPGNATTTQITLAIMVHDYGSGMGIGAQMQFSNDGVTWSTPESFQSTKLWNLTPNAGYKTVYAKFKDVAGNWSSPFSTYVTLQN